MVVRPVETVVEPMVMVSGGVGPGAARGGAPDLPKMVGVFVTARLPVFSRPLKEDSRVSRLPVFAWCCRAVPALVESLARLGGCIVVGEETYG